MFNFWKKFGFEILLVLSIIAIIVIVIVSVCKKKKGTYYNYAIDPKKGINTKKIAPPEPSPQKKSQGKDSSGERECRRVLQKFYGKPFNKARPDFLRNPVTGNNFNLELDCYEASLRLAVEYNGAQHYKYIPYFHKNKESFYNQKYRDDMKRRMCKDNGIRLIEVPYTVKTNDIEQFLIKELNAL